MPRAKEFSLRDSFGTHNGMEVTAVEPGKARARMSVAAHHKNGYGMVHGGAIFTLADLAFAAASNAGNDTVVSINATMSFTKACREGVLFAEAVEVARSSKLVTYEARVADAEGAVVAVFQGIGYIKQARS